MRHPVDQVFFFLLWISWWSVDGQETMWPAWTHVMLHWAEAPMISVCLDEFVVDRCFFPLDMKSGKVSSAECFLLFAYLSYCEASSNAPSSFTLCLCFCVVVCLLLAFKPNFATDGARASSGLLHALHLSLTFIAVSSSALCVHSSLWDLTVACCWCKIDVLTRSNRESIWWGRCRVFQECQGASWQIHAHTHSYKCFHTLKHLLPTSTISQSPPLSHAQLYKSTNTPAQ